MKKFLCAIVTTFLMVITTNNATAGFTYSQHWEGTFVVKNNTQYSLRFLKAENQHHSGHFVISQSLVKANSIIPPGTSIIIGSDQHDKNAVYGKLFFEPVNLAGSGFTIAYNFSEASKDRKFILNNAPGLISLAKMRMDESIEKNKKKKKLGVAKKIDSRYKFTFTIQDKDNHEELLERISLAQTQAKEKAETEENRDALTESDIDPDSDTEPGDNDSSDSDTDEETNRKLGEIKKRLKAEKKATDKNKKRIMKEISELEKTHKKLLEEMKELDQNTTATDS